MLRRLVLSLLLILTAALLTPVTSIAAPTVPRGTPAQPAGEGALPDPTFGPADRKAAVARAQENAMVVAKTLGLGKRETLTARSVERDADGTEHIRYDRTVGGLTVIGGDLVVHQAASGKVTGADFAASNPIASVATEDPRVNAERATKTAGSRQELATGTVGGAELVVWAVSGVPRMAWQVPVNGTDVDGGPVSRVEYVDATSGRYIAGWSLNHYADNDRSLYSGKVSVAAVKKKGKYQLKDANRGNSTTVDVFNQDDPPSGFLKGKIFTDADNKWGNGKASNRQTAAVDVAYGTAKTWDYFKKNFNRKGIRGNNKGATSRVHYSQGLDNAFWNDGCFCMTYGDGGAVFKPLVSLDVAGHEMTHGITSNTANLIYFGESGGLNEATSDIFGTMVEFFAKNGSDKGDYYIGEKLTKPAFGYPFLRRMDQPSEDDLSYDCWSLTMGADDVHFTSGPANKFFYLLAEGTGNKTIGGLPHQGTTCDGSTLSGIGKNDAAAIWYRALTVYMTSTTSYIDARDATIQAAIDLGANCAAVVNAWNAVDVPEGYWTCAGALDEGASVLGSNPGFESGATGWTLGGTAFVTGDPNWGFPHSGVNWANFNGQNATNTSTVTRTVNVPDTATAHLRFSMLVYSEDSTVTEFDTFDVLVNGSSVGPDGHWNNTYANNTYIRWDVPMSAFSGDTVTLQFKGVEDASAVSQFLLDDVTLTPR